MHVGNLRTALYTWLIARHSGGKFILRIEDTDQGRLVEGATEVIYATLRKCGLTWDEGPDIGGDPVGPSSRPSAGRCTASTPSCWWRRATLITASAKKTESEEDSGNFDRAADPCRDMSLEEARAKVRRRPPVIRQKIPAEGSTVFSDAVFGDITVENSTLDDQVLIKRDGLPTYNFANVIDDHLMGITHVVRGSEYLSLRPQVQSAVPGLRLGRTHLYPLLPVMRDAHNKMSKRKGDPSYEDLIAMGYLSEAVVNYVTLLGWSPRGEYAERGVLYPGRAGGDFSTSAASPSPRHLRHRKADLLQRPLPSGDEPRGLPCGRPALHPPGGAESRPLHGGDRRAAPGPVRASHRHPREAGLF